MNFLGIDPGHTGALVLIDQDSTVLNRRVMPTIKLKNGKKTKTVTDYSLLHCFLLECDLEGDYVAFVEQVGAMPGQGVTSMFNFGMNFGAILQALVCNRIAYRLVTPVKWCAKIHKGLSRELDPKSRSELIITRQYPHENYILKGCRKRHSGLMDARLIAEYGRQEWSG